MWNQTGKEKSGNEDLREQADFLNTVILQYYDSFR